MLGFSSGTNIYSSLTNFYANTLVRGVMKRNDTNYDAKIDKEEFQGNAQAFELMDINGDESVTSDEI